MSITIEKVRWSNFLSTGNLPTEIVLNDVKTMLICGSNGSGKSTLMDALCFGLFNKPFRKINKPQLVNSITGKRMLVEIEFFTNKRKYLIRRGMKPNIFEIYQDGNLLNQEADSRDYQSLIERNIIKMTYKTFCQIVVLGSANFTPFMQLPAASRREIIEDLLDIKIFTIMNVLLKERISTNKDNLDSTDHQIELVRNTINLNKKHLEFYKSTNIKNIESKNAQIAEVQQQIDDNNNDIEKLNNNIRELSEQKESGSSILTKFDLATQTKSNLSSKLIKFDKEINYYENTDACNSCKQPITEQFKKDKIQRLEGAKIKTSKNLETLDPILNSLQTKKDQYERLLSDILTLSNQITALQSQNKIFDKQIDTLQNEIKQINNTKIDHIDLSSDKAKVKQLEKERGDLIHERELNNIAFLLLKDTGIKTQIIKQYVPIINTLINKYLEQMEFFCQFEINDQFEEIIKSRFRDDFSYASFSEGEKMRIDLALLFTWREIATARNSSKVNLLILDEIMDSSLDATGTDEFIKIIQQLTGNTNIVIISHKHDQIQDKFDHVIKFTKIKNFSKIDNEERENVI